jgi:Ca2+-binding EF-hand superfamily protein
MKLKDVLIVALIALFPLAVSAGEMQSTYKETFKKLDTNKDGYISKDEAMADKELSKDWSHADKNSDGKVEESEFSAFEENMKSGEMPMNGND